MLWFGTDINIKRRQSISTSRLVGKQIWEKLPALLVLVWLTTENPATDIFISFDMNQFVAKFCLFVALLAQGICAACWHSAFPGSSTAARGPAAPGCLLLQRSMWSTSFGSCVSYVLLLFWDSFCFFMRRNTAMKTIIDSLFTLPGGEEDL